MYEGDFSTS